MFSLKLRANCSKAILNLLQFDGELVPQTDRLTTANRTALLEGDGSAAA